jgi:predicted ATPase
MENTQAYSSSHLLLVSPTPRHNFRAQTTRLIGREIELAELGVLLENPAHRLITIVGPGGIGKTRLALAAAAEQAEAFTHGATFVPLAAISSAALVAPAILAGLNIGLQGQRDPRDQLLDYLREQELLLVLDNFEQLLAPDQSENEGGATLLTDILHYAPGVTLLVTSRERLALQGEWLFDLSGLTYPPGELTEDFEVYSAVQLFVQRAGQVRRKFALVEGEAHAVARICRLAEGLPLAIELAAAALRGRSCTSVADAIESSLAALATSLRAIPERQRSMWATFEHSWRLLSDEERQVFARLSVFRGGFEADAATQVAQATPQLLAALLDKSLLRWDGAARYDMHELVRQFAGEKLEQRGELENLCRRHAEYFLRLAEEGEQKLPGHDQSALLREWLEGEYNNLRAALTWTLGGGDAEVGVRLTVALMPVWEYGYWSEAHAWSQRALALSSGMAPALRASVLRMSAWFSGGQAQAMIEDALALCLLAGDRPGIARTLMEQGALFLGQGDYPRATRLFEESLACYRELGDQQGIASTLHYLGDAVRDQGDTARGASLLEESLTLNRELEDTLGVADDLNALGDVALRQGDIVRATALYWEALGLARSVGGRWVSTWPLHNLGWLALVQGDDGRVRALLEEHVAWWRDKQSVEAAFVPHVLGALVSAQGDARLGTVLLREALVLQQQLGYQALIVESLDGFAWMANSQGQPVWAARLLGATESMVVARTTAWRFAHEYFVAAVRAKLDEDTFATTWAAGRAMTLEQAIAYALEGSATDVDQPALGAAIHSG